MCIRDSSTGSSPIGAKSSPGAAMHSALTAAPIVSARNNAPIDAVSACLRSRAPRFWLMTTEPPLAASATSICPVLIYWLATPTAATALSEYPLSKKILTLPINALRKRSTRMETARLKSRRL